MGFALPIAYRGGETAFSFAVCPMCDILVNNLGIYERKTAFEIPDADWMRLFEVNVLSGVRFARHYGRAWPRPAGAACCSSPANSSPEHPREMIHYGMTKTAQLSISHGQDAMELAGTGA